MTYAELEAISAADYTGMFWWVGLLIAAIVLRFITNILFGK